MKSGAPAEGEIQREARRVLRKLLVPGAKLVPAGSRSYDMMIKGRKGLKRDLRVSEVIIEVFRRRDWIVRDGQHSEAFILSDAGLGWIRRVCAQSDPFASQHQIRVTRDVVAADGTVQTVSVNDGESPLGWLRRRRGPDGRRLITPIQFAAGERLRVDFTLAQLTPRLGVDLTAPVFGGRRGAKQSAPLPETVLAAKQRLRQALNAVGPGLSNLLLDVCCLLTGLETAERQKGWPRRSAKIVLQIALDRLAVHYGLGPTRASGTRLRAWRAIPEGEGEDAHSSN